MYNEKVLQLFSNPKNAGMLKGANGVGEAGKVEDGAFIKLYVFHKFIGCFPFFQVEKTSVIAIKSCC